MENKNYNVIKDILDKRKAEKNNEDKEYSKDKFSKIVKKNITTSFIGSLAKFEKYFGELWGHGINDEDCTPEQLELKKIWQDCRKEILDNGNHQVKCFVEELDYFDVFYLRCKKLNMKKG